MHRYKWFFSCLFLIIFGLINILLHIFIHSLSSYTHHVNIKFKSQLGFERNTNNFFRFCIYNAFRSVKLKVFIQNFGQIGLILCIVFNFSSILVIFRSHFKFNEDIAVASVVYSCLQSFIKTDCDRSKINVWRRDLYSPITSSSYNFYCVFLYEIGLLKLWLLLLILYWKNILTCRFIFHIFIH